MTQDKELLLKDLCSRLPYRVKCKVGNMYDSYTLHSFVTDENLFGLKYYKKRWWCDFGSFSSIIEEVKPYLRPMSCMTNKEYEHTKNMSPLDYFDWLNAHHFDYRGLISKGLALSTEIFNPYK